MIDFYNEESPLGYERHDWIKLCQFLVQDSIIDGKMNGEILNFWKKNCSEDKILKSLKSSKVLKRVLGWDGGRLKGVLEWSNKSLLGNLDLSGCTEIEEVYVDNNFLQNIILSDCKELKIVSACGNILSIFDISNSPKVNSVNLDGNINMNTLEV